MIRNRSLSPFNFYTSGFFNVGGMSFFSKFEKVLLSETFVCRPNHLHKLFPEEQSCLNFVPVFDCDREIVLLWLGPPDELTDILLGCYFCDLNIIM